jgi:hypothetical protein
MFIRRKTLKFDVSDLKAKRFDQKAKKWQLFMGIIRIRFENLAVILDILHLSHLIFKFELMPILPCIIKIIIEVFTKR